MRKKTWAVLITLLAAVGGTSGSIKGALPDDTDCTGTPPNAVMTLPAPLAKWGQISCTPFGHVLASHKDWIWILPTVRKPVFVPSQMVDRMPQPLGNKSYFTKIDVMRISGDEFTRAYETFHEGFDPNEVTPDGYRVDLTSVSGKTVRLYFFDYDTYAWGMECRETKCERDSRFMILDKDHMPSPREPSI
jgi:hypothetical protein